MEEISRRDHQIEGAEEGTVMEGWLYLIRSNYIGFKHARKLYFVLQNRRFNSFKSVSHSYNEDPIRSVVVDSSIHVLDNGRKCIRGKVFFIFTICDMLNYDAHVKLGACNPEEVAGWLKSFLELSQKVNQNSGNFIHCLRPNYSAKVCDKNDVNDILSLASIMDPRTAEIYEPSYWTICGCHNGLRLFKQARDQVSKRNSHPGLAAISVIEETPHVVFQTLMSLGSSRSQWDFCFKKSSVIENIDGHTDIIHKQLDNGWLPWGMKRRDLLLHRYWRKDDNGTYTILYHSVLHNKCPPQKGYIRAFLKCGGYVISPGNQHKQSVVRHMLAIDWKCWMSYIHKSSIRCLNIHMLERLAALRELFKTNFTDYIVPDFTSQELKKDRFLLVEQGEHKGKTPSGDHFMNMDSESDDQFFDFSEPLFDDESEDNQAAVIVEKKRDFVCEWTLHSKSLYAAMEKKGSANVEKIVWDERVSYAYTITLPEDKTGNLPNSWSSPEPSIFQIRGATFLEDRKKITAKSKLLQTVAVDWLKSDKREDHLASRPGNIVQKYATDGRSEFFIVVNFQVPGATTYNLASYYMACTPIKEIPLLERFIEGDDTFRNSRFKLIPHVTKGPWILKQTIHKPTLIGNMLKINYIRGKNYLEMDIDVGSSTTARVVAGKTFSCFSSLIIETAFVIQGNTREELPEHLFGACRLSHLDVNKAVWANP